MSGRHKKIKKVLASQVLMKVQEPGITHSNLVPGVLLLHQLAQLVSLRCLRCNGKRHFKYHFCLTFGEGVTKYGPYLTTNSYTQLTRQCSGLGQRNTSYVYRPKYFIRCDASNLGNVGNHQLTPSWKCFFFNLSK